MTLARKTKFPNKDLKMAEFSKALGHPARIAILQKLAEKKECICGDLVLDLPLAQSTVSQHIKALRDIGLIKGEVDGPRSKYCIDWKAFEQYQSQFTSWIEAMMILQQDNCC